MGIPKKGRVLWKRSRDFETGKRRESVWAELPLRDGWAVAFRYEPREGVPVIAEVRVFFEEDELPAGGLSTRVLRAIRLEEPSRLWAEVHKNLLSLHGPQVVGQRFLRRFGFSGSDTRRPGRGGRDDREYLRLAQQYADLILDGNRTPIKTIARYRPYKDYANPEQSARDDVYEARRRNLLTPTSKGRASGSLTDYAKELLAEGGSK